MFTVRQRSGNASIALATYRRIKYGSEVQVDHADARDLISDLLHNMMQRGMNVEVELRMALNNFTEEANISPYQITRIGR